MKKKDKEIEEKVAECGVKEVKESVWIRKEESSLLHATEMQRMMCTKFLIDDFYFL